MKTDRYNAILKVLPESLVGQMNHIRRFLLQGKASVMVGAGFSRNAEMDASVEMKDWQMLGEDFYERLYSHRPQGRDMVGKSPIRLASQVMATFGRNELDELIANSLPNDRISPSDLHRQLLGLPWVDVFTTNYDTLLEDAALSTMRPYQVVTNKSTLIYRKQPRIIKLHGSFPDIRPFIITEEDYIRYSQTYPEFVNTVRQALIENLFCLIGFSGDDPNFLCWLDWVRDIMKQLMTPVYLITYNPHPNYTEQRLLESRGITPVNLAQITNNGFPIPLKEAFEFFFQYLDTEEPTSLRIDFRAYHDTQCEASKLVELIEKMRQIRLSYQGWFLLPANYYSDFQSDAEDVPSIGNRFEQLTAQQQLHFLYELNWRFYKAMIPIAGTWLLPAIEACVQMEYTNKEDTQMVLALQCSLLTHYRIHGLLEKFTETVEIIMSKEPQLIEHLRNRFYYEQCLFYSYDNARLATLLDKWGVTITNYEGCLWRSYFIAKKSRPEAVKMLTESLLRIQSSLLAKEERSAYLDSLRRLFERQIHIYNREYITDTEVALKYEYKEIDKEIHMRLFEQADEEKEGYSYTYDFVLNTSSRHWYYGTSGLYKDYLYSYRCLILPEYAGTDLYGDTALRRVINTHNNYNSFLVLETLEHHENITDISKYITRGLLAKMPIEHIRIEADRLFFRLQDIANTNERVENTKRTIDFLLRLLTRLGDKEVYRFFQLLMNLAEKNKIQIEQNYLDIIYDVSSPDWFVTKILPELLQYSLKAFNQLGSLSIPKLTSREEKLLTQVPITEEIIESIEKGFLNENADFQIDAYSRWIVAFSMCLTVEQRQRLKIALVHWRNERATPEMIIYSYTALAQTIDDKHNINEYVEPYVRQFVIGNYVFGRSSQQLSIFADNLSKINVLGKWLTLEQRLDVLNVINKFLEDNRTIITKEDHYEMFGDMRSFVERCFYFIGHFAFFLKDMRPENDIIQKFSVLMQEYSKQGLPTMMSQIYLMYGDQSLLEDFITNIIDKLAKTETMELNDYLHSLTWLITERLVQPRQLEAIAQSLMLLYQHSKEDWLKEEECINIYHSVLRLVRELEYYPQLQEQQGLKLWQEYAADTEHHFTDVRMGYYK